MKPARSSSPDPESPETLVAPLRAWEASVDADTAARLASARRRALATIDGNQGSSDWRKSWGAAALATALLALTIGLWPNLPQRHVQTSPVATLEAADAGLAEDADADELLDDDLELSLALSGLDEHT